MREGNAGFQLKIPSAKAPRRKSHHHSLKQQRCPDNPPERPCPDRRRRFRKNLRRSPRRAAPPLVTAVIQFMQLITAEQRSIQQLIRLARLRKHRFQSIGERINRRDILQSFGIHLALGLYAMPAVFKVLDMIGLLRRRLRRGETGAGGFGLGFGGFQANIVPRNDLSYPRIGWPAPRSS